MLYVDGLNLYYGALRGTPLRWLDPVALTAQLFPGFEITKAKYFSAKVVDAVGREGQSVRQMLYWRALRTLPTLEIVEGKFRIRKVWARVAAPPPEMIEVIKAEEKGSDVNLATHLLLDAFRFDVDVFVVISGDSDLVAPVEALTAQLGKVVAVINPQRLSGPNHRRCRGSSELKRVAKYYRGGVTWAQLDKSQFPKTMSDAAGEFHPPAEWTS
jgi:uncharacterized LabA/DUF88 family protein